MHLKIDNTVFEVNGGSIQTTIGSHATLTYTFDIKLHPSYEGIILKIYEMGNRHIISSTNFIASGSYIKYIDIDFNKKMVVYFHCDILTIVDKDQRREESIDEILK